MKILCAKSYVILLHLIFFNEWITNMPGLSELYAGGKRLVLAAIVGFILCNIICNRYSKKRLLLFFALLCSTLYSYFRTHSIWMFYLVCLIFPADMVAPQRLIKNIVRIMRFILIANLIIFTIRFLFFYDGLAITTSRNMVRYDLNFSSAGAASRYFVLYVMAEMINSKGNIKRGVRLLHYLLAIVFFCFTRSEVAFFVFIVYLMIYLRKRRWMRKLIDYGMVLSLPVYTAFTIAAVKFYPSKIFRFFDRLMTGRINLEQRTLLHYGISTWGQFVELPRYIRGLDGKSYLLCLDNTIMSFICNYGWIYLIPILIFPFICRYYLNYYEKAAWCIYSIFFLMIDGGISPFCVFPFLLAASETARKMKIRGRFEKKDTGIFEEVKRKGCLRS